MQHHVATIFCGQQNKSLARCCDHLKNLQITGVPTYFAIEKEFEHLHFLCKSQPKAPTYDLALLDVCYFQLALSQMVTSSNMN